MFLVDPLRSWHPLRLETLSSPVAHPQKAAELLTKVPGISADRAVSGEFREGLEIKVVRTTGQDIGHTGKNNKNDQSILLRPCIA